MYGYKRTFVAGALFGGLVALAFAPKSGRELRKDIETGSEQLKLKTCDLAVEVRERGRILKHDISEKSADLIRKVKGIRCCDECSCECNLECCLDRCCKCCEVCTCECGGSKKEKCCNESCCSKQE